MIPFRSEEPIISELSVLEMISVVSRNIDYIVVDYDFPSFVTPEDKARIIVAYCIKKLNLKILSIRWRRRKLFLPNISLNVSEIIQQASKLAPKLRLRTLDLLHIVLAHKLNADKFLTLDTDIIKKSRIISDLFGLEVIGSLDKVLFSAVLCKL